MAQLLISKKANNDWFHTITTDAGQTDQINDPNVIALGANNEFSISVGAGSYNRVYSGFELNDITLQDDSTSRPVEGPFDSFDLLFLRLAALNYVGFAPKSII